jgi:hypothetical protein
MSNHPTIAEVYRMQYRLIELFGGLHGVPDKGAVEAAVFRPTNRLLQLPRRSSGRADGISREQPRLPLTAISASPSAPPTSSFGATAFTSRSMASTDTRSSTAQWTGKNSASPKSSTGSISTSNPWCNSVFNRVRAARALMAAAIQTPYALMWQLASPRFSRYCWW